ncbi:MAG TPA: hypothetical protein VN770_04465 [Gaiellaceae bacterium]|nr:hypothetical protein [Gaiellaceae bacterium]
MRSALLAIAVVASLALAGCGGGGTTSKADYVKNNEALFKSLPAYPSAKVQHETTSAYSSSSGSSLGYQTRFDLTLPSRVPVETLQSFYAGHLQPDWKLVAQLDGPVLNFRKGDAFVSINLTSAPTKQLEITVDQAYYSLAG